MGGTMTQPQAAMADTRPADAATPGILAELLAPSGVRFNGDAPWDIRVHSTEAYRRILRSGTLGFGEAYMDGLWDCEAIDEMIARIMRADVERQLQGLQKLRLLAEAVRQRLFNRQSGRRAFHVGEAHYDLGNEVFEAMLDPTMTYSCGYWRNADTLEQAQADKLALICRKLELQPGETLLDIGCGWGGLARFAAEHHGATVTGITVSREQQAAARERCAGLPVTIELQDYRTLEGRFDKIVSVGMFEHVGPKNYATYFDTARRLLADDGLFLLHTIGGARTTRVVDPWIERYIFPNGKIPSAEEITAAVNDRLLVEDWHNFGPDYDPTLMAWWRNFEAAWPGLEDQYDRRFYRMWRFYLLSCAGFFRSRRGQLWQIVLSRKSRTAAYRSIR